MPRVTRRTRKQIEETAEDVPVETTEDETEIEEQQIQQIEDNGSSNFASSTEKEEETNLTDEQEQEQEELMEQESEAFHADSMAESENANSLPSACDDHSFNFLMDNNSIEMQPNDKTDDTLAQKEYLNHEDPDATSLDAENISEDELPAPVKPKVQDAEEVSDEELPGPKVEMPEDTEVVSEDELPVLKKRKHDDYDPNDPTDDSGEKRLKTEDEKPKYASPDLEKYWKAVNADKEDFNAWTYLLQYVDGESDVDSAREAYDAFLGRYSYCYGYWRKYADYEKKKGSLELCDQVFERGLKAIPLSIDLWIHYLTHIKQKFEGDRDKIREQFDRALNTCGLEFRSDKLWDGFIRWENEEKNVLNVMKIYDRLLATPTQGYKTHWENFREFVNNNPVQKLVPVDEFMKMREEVRKDSDEKLTDDQVPPGEDEPNDHVRSEEEAEAIRKLILNKRKKINKTTIEMINKRWTFEEGIKRPYFHVKQLERIQLKNWKEYLDFEIEQGDKTRILVLFERCLIACALYEEFWLKLIRYLETQNDDPEQESRLRDAYERACTIHQPNKPSLMVMWATFEESFGGIDKAAEILARVDQAHPNLLQIAYYRINLERRRGNFTKSVELYEQHLAQAKNKNIAASIAIKYSRFLNKTMNDFDGAMKLLKKTLIKDPQNSRLALQIIDLALQRPQINDSEVLEVIEGFMNQDGLDLEQKLLFAQRKVEFLEDFGNSIKDLHDAQKSLQNILEKTKENRKKSSENETSSSTKKTKEASASSNNGSYTSNTPYAYSQTHYGNSTYPYTSNATYDYNQQSYYQQGAYGYGNQWGSYGSSY